MARRRRRVWIALLAAIVAVGTVGVLVFATREEDDEAVRDVEVGAVFSPGEGRSATDAALVAELAEHYRGVAAFWTPERLAGARPMDLAGPEGAASEDGVPPAPAVPPGSVAGSPPLDAQGPLGAPPRLAKASTQLPAARGYAYTRYRWRGSLSLYPATTHGKVFFVDPADNEEYVCSATVVNTGNRSVVWTAGHCVYNNEICQWMQNWVFKPAYEGGAHPEFGEWPARMGGLAATTGWTGKTSDGTCIGGSFNFDLGAALLVRSPNGRGIADVVGSRGISWNNPRPVAKLRLRGYPAAPPFTGERLYVCDGRRGPDDGPDGAGPTPMGVGCDMTGGSSGGAWVLRGNVVSVNSYGPPNVMFGPYQGPAAAALYDLLNSIPS